MIAEIVRRGAAPSVVWVGEPTLLGVLSAHKGIRDYEVRITGKAAHSSDPRLGASAIHEAIDLLGVLRKIAREQEAMPQDIGLRSVVDDDHCRRDRRRHGVVLSRANAASCSMCACVPGSDPDAMLAPFFRGERVNAKLSALGPECGVVVDLRASAPPLRVDRESAAERFIRVLTGDNQLRWRRSQRRRASSSAPAFLR